MNEDQEFRKIMKGALEEHISQPSMSFSKNVMNAVKSTKRQDAFDGKAFVMVCSILLIGVFLLLIFQQAESGSLLDDGYQEVLNKWQTLKFPKTVGYGLISILVLLLVQIRLLSSKEINN
ncbi:MAG: hypothetical protein JXR19_05915 [Bacteroidia bacterium]